MRKTPITPEQYAALGELELFSVQVYKREDKVENPHLLRVASIGTMRGLFAQITAYLMAHAVALSKRPIPDGFDADQAREDLLALGAFRHLGLTAGVQQLLNTDAIDGSLVSRAMACLYEANIRCWRGVVLFNATLTGGPVVNGKDHHQLFGSMHRRFLLALDWAAEQGHAPDNADELRKLTEVLSHSRALLTVQQVTVDTLFHRH